MSARDVWLRSFGGGKAIAPPPLLYEFAPKPVFANRSSLDLGGMHRVFPNYFFGGGAADLFPVEFSADPTFKTTLDPNQNAFFRYLRQSHSIYSVGSALLVLADHCYTEDKIVIGDGAEMPVELACVKIEAYDHGEQPADNIQDGMLCTTAQATRSLLMFSSKDNGQPQASGVYVCVRPVANKAGQIDYTDARIPQNFLINEFAVLFGAVVEYIDKPELCVLECGTVVDGSYSPASQTLVSGYDFNVRAGLARRDITSNQGTVFAVNAYTPYGSLGYGKFSFTPQSPSHAFIGWLTANAGLVSLYSNNLNLYWNLWSFGNFPGPGLRYASRGFLAGSPPALWLKDADHATITQAAFFDGAVATPSVNSLTIRIPRASEWSQWGKSQFTYSLHGCDSGLRPSGTITPSIGVKPTSEIVVFAQREYAHNLGSADFPFLSNARQLHPLDDVPGKAAALQTAPDACHFDERSDALLSPPSHGNFVFDGKIITKLTVSFSPFLPESSAIPTGDFEPAPAPTILGLLGQDFTSPSLATNVLIGGGSGFYWQNTGSLPVPSNGIVIDVLLAASDTVYSGKISVGTPAAVAGGEVYVTRAAGNVSAEIENNALLSLSRALPSLPSRDFQPAHELYPRNNPQTAAPPSGSYDLEPFSFSGVASAPGVMRHAGAGDWSASKTFTITNYHEIQTISHEWRKIGTLGAFDRYTYDSTKTSSVHEVVATQEISLSCDHIEIYGFLGSCLQEAGTYIATPPDNWTADQIADFNNDVITSPRGRIENVIDYAVGSEPHALLRLTLFARTVMRGTANVSVDASDLEWPYEAQTSEKPSYGASVIGIGGTGYIGSSVLDTHHPFARLDYTFSRDQTLALLAGRSVDLTRWLQDEPHKFALMDFGVQFFSYRVTVSATVENA